MPRFTIALLCKIISITIRVRKPLFSILLIAGMIMTPVFHHNKLYAVIQSAPASQEMILHQQQEQADHIERLRKKYPQVFIFHGNAQRKEVALTFDDAPDYRFTPRILDILKEHHVKATFFIVGFRAVIQQGIVKRIAMENHEIGNHTYDHPYLPPLSEPQFAQEIKKTQQAILDITQIAPTLIRPPFGAITEKQLIWAREHHFKVVNWNVDTMDWKGLPAYRVIRNVFRQIRPGAIILQHAGGGSNSDLEGTIQALPLLIQSLRAEGYTFVTIPELLQETHA
ncbi:polysaccharide deacetylase family protein [Marinicrinis sediminis]|uniref:Polysaccharide deacetylase family protein n=1 Tax=Marinicrinis sediminis TaxID=1652465 RepID=A0ABW5R4S5_9BACL